MSMIPRCVVCDDRVANIYAPDSRCERCQLPCPTCQGDVAHCQHPLRAADTSDGLAVLPCDATARQVERELRFTIEMQGRNAA